MIRLAGSSNRGLSASERKRKRRWSAIEPVIGHLKSDHRLDRCFLRGRIGDATNLLGSALGFNVSKLLRLLGRGIFSHAPTVFDRFLPTACRFVSATCHFVTATIKNWATMRRPRIRPENLKPRPAR